MQVLVELGPIVVGLHATEDGVGGVSVMVAVLDVPFSVAVTVADWLVVNEPEVAVNVAVVAAAATVTEAGTVRVLLLLDKVTLLPPVGAAWLSVTVQELVALGPMFEGVHTSDVGVGVVPVTRLMVAVFEMPFSVAVTVAVWLVVNAPAAAVKVAVVALAATVTGDVTVSALLLLETANTVPPVGAAAVRVIVQVELVDGLSVVGEQASADTWGTVIVPPVPVTVRAVPEGEAPATFDKPNAFVVAEGASVTVKLAIAPEVSAAVFKPLNKQVYAPEAFAHCRVFPAFDASIPIEPVIPVIFAGS